MDRKKAIIYCRVSGDAQEEAGLSLPAQEAECRRYAATKGYDVYEVLSGVEKNEVLEGRPLLQSIRDRWYSGEFQALIVVRGDRLVRDPVYRIIALREAWAAGITPHYVTEPLENTPEGELLQFISGWTDKQEKRRLVERSLRSKKFRVDSGRIHNSGADKYGYRRDKERGVRVIEVSDPTENLQLQQEISVIRDIFRWYVEESESANGIQIRLNGMNIPSPSDGKVNRGRKTRWGHSVVKQFLSEPAYKGEEVVWRKVLDKGKAVDRPEEDWVPIPSTPALVSKEIWDRAQVLLARRSVKGARKRNASRPCLLRGMIFCPCGSRAYPERKDGKLYYRCSYRKCGYRTVPAETTVTKLKRKNGHWLSIPAETKPGVEEYIWGRMKDFLLSPTTIKVMLEAQLTRHRSDGSARELESAQAQWRGKKVEQERLLDLYVKARLSEERFTEKDTELVAQLQGIEENIERLERQVINQQQAIANYQKVEEVVQEARRADLQHLNFEQKRQMLQTFQARVTAHGGDSVNWHLQLMVDVKPIDSETLQALIAEDDSELDVELGGEVDSTCRRVGSRDTG